MAGLMYLTQQLNPTPPNMDPVQMQVMKVMPVAISVIFICCFESCSVFCCKRGVFINSTKNDVQQIRSLDFKAPGGG